MMISWIIAAFLITVIPLFMGVLLVEWTNKERTIGRAFVYGWVSIFAIVELYALPVIFLGQSLGLLTGVVSVTCFVIIAAGLFVSKKNIITYVKNTWGLIKNAGIIWLLPLALICTQMYHYFVKANPDADDAFYLATASTSVVTNSLFKFSPYTGELYSTLPSRYVLSPLPSLYAIISRLSGLHVAIIAHTLIPIVFILVTYFVYVILGRKLFDNDMRRTGVFVFFLALIFTFSGVTTHTVGMVFLVRIWQGKAILASILVPLIFTTIIENGKQSIGIKNGVLLMVILIACCFVSSMGILLGPLCLGMILVSYFILDKKISWVLPGIVSCIPSVLLALAYLAIK